MSDINSAPGGGAPKTKMRGPFKFLLGLLILLFAAVAVIAVITIRSNNPEGVLKKYCKALNDVDVIEFYNCTTAKADDSIQLDLSKAEYDSVVEYMKALKKGCGGDVQIKKTKVKKIRDFEDTDEYDFIMASYKERGLDIDIKAMSEINVTFENAGKVRLVAYKAGKTWVIFDNEFMQYVSNKGEYVYSIPGKRLG